MRSSDSRTPDIDQYGLKMGNDSRWLKRRGGFSFDRDGRFLLYVSFVLLLISGALNLTLLSDRSASVKEADVKSHLASDFAAANQCPSINCSHVCARAQVNEVISSAKEEIFTASKDAHLTSTKGQASKLDDTLLFVGIISGRGYRLAFTSLCPCIPTVRL